MRTLKKLFIVTVFTCLTFSTKVKADVIPTPINRWGIQLSLGEIELLCRIVQLEAGGEIREGKYATTEAILNRIISNKYPNTLIEVLSQKSQFGTWKNVATIKATPTMDTYESVFLVLTGQTNVLDIDRTKFNTEPIGTDPIKIDNQYYGK